MQTSVNPNVAFVLGRRPALRSVPSPHAGEGQGGGCAPNQGSCSFSNDDQDAFEIGENLFIRESQHVISARREPSVAYRVMALPRVEVVCSSVELHDEASGMAYKIDDILSHWRLSTERESIKVMSLEIAPQDNLRARHRAAEVFRPMALQLIDGGVRHARLPPSLSLPRRGGGNAVAPVFVPPSLHSRHAFAHQLSPPASVGRSSGRKP